MHWGAAVVEEGMELLTLLEDFVVNEVFVVRSGSLVCKLESVMHSGEFLFEGFAVL